VPALNKVRNHSESERERERELMIHFMREADGTDTACGTS
jgi:hypothetical protein